ncbi:MAG TPA: hypothetical protein VFS43_14405 [Polyangiaceae bacterium]|nr:hypothetical protein [Polyangiaceae bacterium]
MWSRRSMLALPAALWLPRPAAAAKPSPLAEPAAPADVRFRFLGAASREVPSQGKFAIANRGRDELMLSVWDGVNLHSSLERLVNGAWQALPLGYCGLGHSPPVKLPPGARREVSAYVGAGSGTFRVRYTIERKRRDPATGAEVWDAEPLVSLPFSRA